MPVEKPKTSFRGVAFYVKSHEIQIGRRNTLHAVPFSDTGARANDVGRAPRRFTFTAVFVGINYRIDRDKLIDALETAGPGVLTHPEFGRLLCYSDDRVTLRETTTAINRCEFSFTLTEAADQQVQRNPIAPLGTITKQKFKGIAAAERIFVERIGYPAVSDFVEATRLDAIGSVLTGLQGINGALGTALAVPSGYASQIDSISNNIAALAATPRRVFTSITAVMDEISQGVRLVLGPAGLEGNATQAADYFGYTSRTSDGLSSVAVAGRAAALLGAESEPVADPTAQAEIDVIQTTMRTVMLLSLADAVQDLPLDSTRDIAGVRRGLIDSMISVADADATDTELANVLRDAAAGLSAHLRDIENGLTTYTPGYPIPAEVVAHLLYADPERADEIVARNRPRDPGALDAHTAIEVRRA
jgi:prophage DNA circulation protein